MREAIVIALAMFLGVVVGASGFDLEKDVEDALRPVAIQINRTQSSTPKNDWIQALETLQKFQKTTSNRYVLLGLNKISTKLQGIIDRDLTSAPAPSVINALAQTYPR